MSLPIVLPPAGRGFTSSLSSCRSFGSNAAAAWLEAVGVVSCVHAVAGAEGSECGAQVSACGSVSVSACAWLQAGKGTTHSARMSRTFPLSRDVCRICRTSTSYMVVLRPFFHVCSMEHTASDDVSSSTAVALAVSSGHQDSAMFFHPQSSACHCQMISPWLKAHCSTSAVKNCMVSGGFWPWSPLCSQVCKLLAGVDEALHAGWSWLEAWDQVCCP